MSQTVTRVAFPDEPIVGPQIHEVGNNPPPDSNTVTRVDASKGFLPRLRSVFWPGNEGQPAKQAPRQPQIPPAEELAQLETLLPHLESQLAAAQRILEADPGGQWTGNWTPRPRSEDRPVIRHDATIDDQDDYDPVYIRWARCPACDSRNVQTIRSEQNGDGTVTRRSQCRDCFIKFRVVVE